MVGRASNRKIVYDFYGFSYFYDLRFFWKPVKIVKTVKTSWPLFSTFCNNNDQFKEVACCYLEPISPWKASSSSSSWTGGPWQGSHRTRRRGAKLIAYGLHVRNEFRKFQWAGSRSMIALRLKLVCIGAHKRCHFHQFEFGVSTLEAGVSSVPWLAWCRWADPIWIFIWLQKRSLLFFELLFLDRVHFNKRRSPRFRSELTLWT